MAKATTENEKHQEFIDRMRVEHGKVIHVVIEGELLVFRRPKRAELVNMNKAARKQPELAIEHSIGLCGVCHVGPGPTGLKGDVDKWASEYTVLFAGSEDFKGISDHLIDLSKGESTIVLS